MDGPIDVERVCALLRDPEIDVQTIAPSMWCIKANHPDTIRYLIDVLKDENENARRAAVEVLNEVGNAKSVKYLLAGAQGQRLVGAQPRRRCARQDRRPEGHRCGAAAGARQGRGHPARRDRDPQPDQGRARGGSLIQATRDNDWWVSERAVDALAEIGSKRAVPRLMEMLHTPANGKALPIVVRALGKLGDGKLVDALLPLIARPEREIRIEAIQALARVADESRAEQVRTELQAQAASPDQTISRMASAAHDRARQSHRRHHVAGLR